ncbi:AraC family transcriptional regulator [Prolixibacteraceae bacterium]|nr:AraC family transcriptional regulator [Prolixibacteraceae bacterium]
MYNKYIEVTDILATIRNVGSLFVGDEDNHTPNLYLLCQLVKEQLLDLYDIQSIRFRNPHMMRNTVSQVSVERYLTIVNYIIHTWQTSYRYTQLEKVSFESLDKNGAWRMEFNFNYSFISSEFISFISTLRSQKDIACYLFKDNAKLVLSLLEASNAGISLRAVDDKHVCFYLTFNNLNENVHVAKRKSIFSSSPSIKRVERTHRAPVLLNLVDDKTFDLSFIKHDWTKLSAVDIVVLQKFIKEVCDHLDQPDFSIKALSDAMGIGRTTLFHKIKKITGLTPNDFILQMRLSKAQDLLKHEYDMQVSEIAYSVGFSSPCYFSRAFKSYCGVSPKKFRDQNSL